MSAALHTEFDPLSPAYLRNPTPTLKRLPTLRVPPTFQRDYLPLMTVTGLQALQVDLRP